MGYLFGVPILKISPIICSILLRGHDKLCQDHTTTIGVAKEDLLINNIAFPYFMWLEIRLLRDSVRCFYPFNHIQPNYNLFSIQQRTQKIPIPKRKILKLIITPPG